MLQSVLTSISKTAITSLTMIVCFIMLSVIGAIIEPLTARYKKWKIFLSGTLICLGFYGLIFMMFRISRIGDHDTIHTDLNIWQYLIIFDLGVYFLFSLSMLLLVLKKKKR